MIKIYFWEQKKLRQRQRDTVEQAAAVCEIVNSRKIIEQKDSATETSERRSGKRRAIEFLARWIVPVNSGFVPAASAVLADLIYCWGKLPLFSRKDYLLELDNPYVLSFYNPQRFKFLKRLFQYLLIAPRCRMIICISQACQRSLLQELGSELAAKTKVLYPYIEQAPSGIEPEPKHFLFVANDFFLKGGKELVHAFVRLQADQPDARLTVVSNVPATFITRYQNSRIDFVAAGISRRHLRETYFSKAAVFVLPTFQDSFGMVLLEALSYGLPIISTNLFAIPEIVQDNQTGFLLQPPLIYFKSDGTAEDSNWSRDFLDDTANSSFPAFEEQLLQALRKLCDPQILSSCRAAAEQLFLSRFAPTLRQQQFAQLLNEIH